MRSSVRIHSCAAVAAVAVVAALAVGCSSGTGSSTPTSNDYDDVAQSTAAIIATPGGGGEITSMYDVATISVGTTPSGATVTASGSFSTLHAGVTYAYTVSCTDAHGNALAQCGPTTNDAQASVSWSGTLSVPDYTENVTRTGNWSVSGIQTGAATFNGTGSFNYSSTFESAFRNEKASANLTYGATYDAVVYDEATGLVSGGTVDYTINASGMASSTSGSASGNFTIDAVVTFAPGGPATIVLDGSHTYTVTASGVVTKI